MYFIHSNYNSLLKYYCRKIQNIQGFLMCDATKQNESKLANTQFFKIQPNKADSFFYFLLFVQSFN